MKQAIMLTAVYLQGNPFFQNSANSIRANLFFRPDCSFEKIDLPGFLDGLLIPQHLQNNTPFIGEHY